MNTVDVLDFVFDYKCRDWSDAYVHALGILREDAKDRWIIVDVLDAIERAIIREQEMKDNPALWLKTKP